MKTYALECEDGCYYIGKSNNVEHRISRHFSSSPKSGAAWTRLHRPIKVVCIVEGDHEKSMYCYAVAKYGKDKVRGYAFCQSK